MRHFWLFAHLLGFTLWLGGAAAAMAVGIAMKRESRESLASGIRLLAVIYRVLIGPGAIVTTISGLILTLRLYGTAMSVGGLPHGLMMMQATGILAALLALVVSVPTASKVARLDPVRDAAVFDGLRKRMRVTGAITGVLGLLALLGGTLIR